MSPEILVVFSIILVAAQGKLVPTRRPFGGQNAQENELPYQVSIQTDKMEHFCGGSILSDQWIITADHCVGDEYFRPDVIIAGTINQNVPEKGAQVVPIAKIFSHKDWKTQGSRNADIALLKLQKPLTLNDAVKPISLPKFKAKVGGNGTISEYGIVEPGYHDIPILRKSDVVILDREMCMKQLALVRISAEVAPGEMCTLSDDAIPRSSCRGDSGGPVAQKKPSGVSVLIGVITRIVSLCGQPGVPAIHVNVAEFVDWIQATMKNN